MSSSVPFQPMPQQKRKVLDRSTVIPGLASVYIESGGRATASLMSDKGLVCESKAYESSSQLITHCQATTLAWYCAVQGVALEDQRRERRAPATTEEPRITDILIRGSAECKYGCP